MFTFPSLYIMWRNQMVHKLRYPAKRMSTLEVGMSSGEDRTRCSLSQEKNATQKTSSIVNGTSSAVSTESVNYISLQNGMKNGISKTVNPSNRRKLYKSPNILIYTGKKFAASYFTEVKELLLSCVGYSSYTIYHLKHDMVLSSPWQDNCVLLIIAVEQIYEGRSEIFLKYFIEGGNILSCCSNFDRNIISSLNVDIQRNSIQIVETQYRDTKVNLEQGRHYYTNTSSLLPDTQLSVLATTDCGRAVIVEASHARQGRCILSQVHIDKSAEQVALDSATLNLLAESEAPRLSIMMDSLHRLGIDVLADSARDSKVTRCTMHCVDGEALRNEFLKKVRLCHSAKVKGDILTVSKVGEYDLSVDEDTSLNEFNWSVYKDNLTAKALGRILVYQHVSNTTMSMVEPLQFCSPPNCGVVAVAGQQLDGIGRGGNTWLSPPGSLAMTMLVKAGLQSNLGRTPSLIQTIPAVAVSRVIHHHLQSHTNNSEGEIKVQVKWPNDIYYGKVKIGGVLVRSTILQNTLHCAVGVGVNVINQKPTVNVNDVINEYNAAHNTSVPSVSLEYMAAKVCSEMERLIDLVNSDKMEYMNVYYQYWLHSGKRVDVPNQGTKSALILGLDDYGFLKIQKEDGSTFSVQPDGNTYDMMHNMIKVKS